MVLSRIQQMERMCYTVPFMPDKNPFCTVRLTMLFCRRNVSSLLARIRWNSLETTGVRAMGRKLLDWDGSPSLKIKMILAWDQDSGPLCEDSSILVKTVARK